MNKMKDNYCSCLAKHYVTLNLQLFFCPYNCISLGKHCISILFSLCTFSWQIFANGRQLGIYKNSVLVLLFLGNVTCIQPVYNKYFNHFNCGMTLSEGESLSIGISKCLNAFLCLLNSLKLFIMNLKHQKKYLWLYHLFLLHTV